MPLPITCEGSADCCEAKDCFEYLPCVQLLSFGPPTQEGPHGGSCGGSTGPGKYQHSQHFAFGVVISRRIDKHVLGRRLWELCNLYQSFWRSPSAGERVSVPTLGVHTWEHAVCASQLSTRPDSKANSDNEESNRRLPSIS